MCSVRAIDYFGVARRNSDTAVPFPYKSGGDDVLCAGDRLFWGSAKKFGHGSAVSLQIG
jgi:hypothetical protein